jgi:hypothetical protein
MATTEAQSDANMSDSDSSIFLSEPLGAKTLDARSMVPAEFQEPPDADAAHTLVWMNGRQFLKVDHAANIRMGSPVSKILGKTRYRFLISKTLICSRGGIGPGKSTLRSHNMRWILLQYLLLPQNVREHSAVQRN